MELRTKENKSDRNRNKIQIGLGTKKQNKIDGTWNKSNQNSQNLDLEQNKAVGTKTKQVEQTLSRWNKYKTGRIWNKIQNKQKSKDLEQN